MYLGVFNILVYITSAGFLSRFTLEKSNEADSFDSFHANGFIQSISHPVAANKKVLIATPIKNGENELPTYFKSLETLTYPHNLITISILESDSADNTVGIVKNYQNTSDSSPNPFNKIILTEYSTNYVSPVDRHAKHVQFLRRQVLADARNALLRASNLSNFDYVLWLDVDAVGFKPSLLEDLIKVNRSIVALHVVWGHGGSTYDRNSWWETEPADVWDNTIDMSDEKHVMFEGYEQQPGYRLYLDDYYRLLKDSSGLVQLHGVGTACLLVEARVHLEGVIFPIIPYKRRVESEGFGLLALDHGYQPWGLPRYEIIHKNSVDKTGDEKEREEQEHFYSRTILMLKFFVIAVILYILSLKVNSFTTGFVLRRLRMFYKHHVSK